jgi:hypothetical protein
MSGENPSSNLLHSDPWVTNVVLILAAGLLVGLGYLAWHKPDNLALPAFLILISLGVFVLLMIYAANALKTSGVFDVTQPFGLPPGTIRAVLTLAFIILIGVFGSLVLLRSEGRSPLTPLAGLQGLAVKSDELAQLRQSLGEDVVVVATSSGANTVTVSAYVKRDYRAADSIAQNIISMLSTLLAAMIGFYFGARIDGGGDAGGGSKPEPDTVALQGQIDASTKALTRGKGLLASLQATDRTTLDNAALKKLDADTKATADVVKSLETELGRATATHNDGAATAQARRQQTEDLKQATAKLRE